MAEDLIPGIDIRIELGDFLFHIVRDVTEESSTRKFQLEVEEFQFLFENTRSDDHVTGAFRFANGERDIDRSWDRDIPRFLQDRDPDDNSVLAEDFGLIDII